MHIEQGPVLNELDMPLGIVTSINGSVRCLGQITGMGSHAGTTPMGQRRDAVPAMAELALYLERRAASVPDVVGTIGQSGSTVCGVRAWAVEPSSSPTRSADANFIRGTGSSTRAGPRA